MARPDDGAAAPEWSDPAAVLFSCSPSGRVHATGAALSRLSGRPLDGLVDVGVEQLFHPSSHARLRRVLAAADDSATSGGATFSLLHADGYEVALDLSWSVLTGPRADASQVVFAAAAPAGAPYEGAVADGALRASEVMFRAIADTSEEGIWVVGPTGRTLYANTRLAAILGTPPEQVRDVDLMAVFDPDSTIRTSGRLRNPRDAGPQRFEFPYAHPDGHERRLRVVAAPLQSEAGTPEATLAMVSDITDVRRVEQALRTAVLQDGLTQLPNRTLLVERLTHALTTAEHCTAVLLVDLDHFRMVNDSRGHDVGDQLLVGVSARLLGAVPGHVTVARFGGDEFVVVCEGTDEQQAHAVARRLLAALDQPFRIDDATVHVAASIGVAVAPAGSGTSAVDLLRHADTAVHAAKGAGRGRVHVFEDTLGEDVEHRYALSSDLRAALAEESLHLEYQPVVDLRTGGILGLEALARWTHPDRGPVPPASFVAVAELAGLAPELDRWVSRRAVHDMAALRAAGVVQEDAYVAVNLSATNLTDALVVDDLLRWTEEARFPTTQVVLEITETAIMQNTDVAVRLLRRLRDQGFRVALDDFGTGYSSLAYLRDLPISALKIDRSFVAGITEHPDVLAIVASIVDLAGAVGVDVVAEGVETPGQRALLQRLGVTAAQGWLWSAALPYAALLGGGACTGPLAAAPGATVDSAITRRRNGDPGVVHGVQRLLELHRHGASVDAIAATLDAEGHRTPAGLRWQPTSVARVIAHQIRRAAGPPDGCTGARRPVRGEGRAARLDGLGQPFLRPSGGAADTPATPSGQD